MAQPVTIARAVLSNLIVFRDRADVPIDEVVARHPSHVILLERERSQVCVTTPGDSETKHTVPLGCVDASLTSIVRRLVRGDVPTSIWWTADVSELAPLPAIVELSRQLVYDSRLWRDVRAGVAALAAVQRVDAADLNWRRLAPMRRAIIEACRARNVQAVDPGDVRVRCRTGDEAMGWLAIGWFSARLGWPPHSAEGVAPAEHDDHVLTISVGRAASALTVTMRDDRIDVAAEDAAPFAVHVPHEDEADAVAAELRTLSRDGGLREALDALSDRFAVVSR